MDLKAYTLLLLYLILNLQSAQANFICTGQTIYYKAKQVDVVAPPKINGKPDYQAAKKTCREAVKASKDGFICTGQSIYYQAKQVDVVAPPKKNGKPDYQAAKKICREAVKASKDGFICTGQSIYYQGKQVDVVAPPKKNGKPDYQAAKKTCREAVKASKDGFICTGQSIYRKDQYNETLDSPEACRKIIASLDSVVKKMECEEVYETYAICNGIRYNVDLSIKDTLSRDVKTIINRSPLEKDGTSTINK